jgi:uncharacterized protein (TIGR03083 family)
MEQQVDRVELLRRLDHEYSRFQAAVSFLSEEQMEMPGVVGAWSIKDLIAHFIAHEQFALQELQYALRGEAFAVAPAEADAINERAVAERRQHSLDQVIREWEQSYRQVVAAVEALSDADFDPAGPVVQALGDTIDGALGNNTYDHYAEHLPSVEAWIAGKRS